MKTSKRCVKFLSLIFILKCLSKFNLIRNEVDVFKQIISRNAVKEFGGFSNVHDLIRVVKVISPPVRLVPAVRVGEQWLTSRAVGELHVISERVYFKWYCSYWSYGSWNNSWRVVQLVKCVSWKVSSSRSGFVLDTGAFTCVGFNCRLSLASITLSSINKKFTKLIHLLTLQTQYDHWRFSQYLQYSTTIYAS